MDDVLVPQRPLGQAIPRRLTHIFLGGPLPEAMAANVAGIRAGNPGWDHVLYGDREAEAFILDGYGPSVLALYRRLSPLYPAARADLLRYLVLYRVGGVYLDVKSGAGRPFDTVLRPDDRFLLAQWRNGAGSATQGWGLHAELADLPGGEFQQWHVIAAPGHPFLHAVLDRVLRGIRDYRVREDETGWLGVLRLTGPIAYTRAIQPLLATAPFRRVADETALGLTYNVLGASAHKHLSGRHYTTVTAPLVDRGFLLGCWDRAYLRVRAAKRRRDAARRSAGGAEPAD